MAIETVKAFYQRYLQRCNAHDFDALDEFVAVDVRVNGKPCGLRRYQQGLADIVNAFPDYHWKLEQVIVEGNILCAQFTDSGTHAGAFLGVNPTGTFVTTIELAIYQFIDGQITDVWVTADNVHILHQLSSVPNA